jgi:hypothetical protein
VAPRESAFHRPRNIGMEFNLKPAGITLFAPVSSHVCHSASLVGTLLASLKVEVANGSALQIAVALPRTIPRSRIPTSQRRLDAEFNRPDAGTQNGTLTTSPFHL